MKKSKPLAVLNLFCFLIHLGTTWLVQTKQINRFNIQEVSDRYTSLFTPAPITFGIWGLIYLSLLASCIYQLVVAFTKKQVWGPGSGQWFLLAMGPWFAINSLATAAWLIAFSKQRIGLSVGLIGFQWISLLIIAIRTRLYHPVAQPGEKIFAQFPFSLYFGWITVAFFANLNAWLPEWGFHYFGLSAVYWTVYQIIAVVFLMLIFVLGTQNVVMGLVGIWALYGIMLKRESAAIQAESVIIYSCWAGMVVLAAGCVLQFIKNIANSQSIRGPHGLSYESFPSPEEPLK